MEPPGTFINVPARTHLSSSTQLHTHNTHSPPQFFIVLSLPVLFLFFHSLTFLSLWPGSCGRDTHDKVSLSKSLHVCLKEERYSQKASKHWIDGGGDLTQGLAAYPPSTLAHRWILLEPKNQQQGREQNKMVSCIHNGINLLPNCQITIRCSWKMHKFSQIQISICECNKHVAAIKRFI